ncbi:MAG TPA: hypothetical protein VGK16_05060 [Candidatus Limnocylindrales bacterium]|jgi:hypothetical protein
MRLSAMNSRLVLVLALGVVVAACSPTSMPPTVSPTPGQVVQATVEPAAAPRCPQRSDDATATLGPAFDQDVFVRHESEAIATAFVAGLSAIYADPAAVDVCRFFTQQGWESALVSDPLLRAAERGETRVAGDLVLRIAFEGRYDLRERPPVVPLDVIFDIPAVAGTSVVRTGFNVVFVFDGHRWRADRVGEVTPENLAWTRLPSVPPPGPPCAGFVRDPVGTKFDERAERGWCDGGGSGRTISSEQLVLLTQYPCEVGHAAVLNVGRPLGTSLDPLDRREYVRDPAKEFLAQRWVISPFEGAATLPLDAADTGWTNGNVDLWISPTELDRAVYIVRGDTVERWPRAASSWGVGDCN